MKDLFFYDADCCVGRSPLNGNEPTVKELLADMDYYGVDKALLRHGNVDMIGAEAANAEIAKILRENDPEERLSGVWYILPTESSDIPEPDEFIRQMGQNRIKAIALTPHCHRFVPNRMVIGKMMDAAKERKIPVFIDKIYNFSLPPVEAWEGFYRFVDTFQDNILVSSSLAQKWGCDRQIRPLLANYANFHFVTTGYWVPEGLRDLAELYGADRIIAGSGFPRYNLGSQMLQIKFSGMNGEDVAKTAGKNLERILGEAQI